jgi:hypothetical protein
VTGGFSLEGSSFTPSNFGEMNFGGESSFQVQGDTPFQFQSDNDESNMFSTIPATITSDAPEVTANEHSGTTGIADPRAFGRRGE